MKMPVFGVPWMRWRDFPAKIPLLILMLGLEVVSGNALAEDALDKIIKLDIQENTRLEDALIEWGTKTGVTVMINTPTVTHQVSHGIHGALNARKALLQILGDSGLSYTQEGERIRIVPAAAMVRSVLIDPASLSVVSPALASNAIGSNASDAADDASENQSEARSKRLETVVVTAQKREERLLDVPVPVSTLSADDLLENNKLGLSDYFTAIPGVTVTSGGTGIPPGQVVAIRGLNNLGGSQTTGVVVDDISIVPGSGNSGLVLPDIDPSSLSHIEVLRGPQGTLYGASSLGGLIKYVTVSPSTAGLSGHVVAGTETIDHGTGVGYNFRGAINLPLGGDWATRISAFITKHPGYIDNPAIGIDGINDFHSEGGHLAVLWQPAESLSLRLTAILQRNYGGASTFSNLIPNVFIPEFPAPVGNFQQVAIKQIPVESKQQIYAAVLKAKIGDVNLTSVSGYIANSFTGSADLSVLNGLTQPMFGVDGVAIQSFGRIGKLNQEIRLSGPITPHFDFLLGAFYTYEDSANRFRLPATDPFTGAEAGELYHATGPQKYWEYAGFADLTFHATQQLDIQVGARDSQIRQTFRNTFYGLFYNQLAFGVSDPVYAAPKEYSYGNAVTYLVAPSYRISHDLMVYARVASGYRPGGPNGALPDVPPSYKADTTTEYDLGLKAEFWGRRISMDLSAYYIDWKNIQVSVATESGNPYTGNAGGAKSQGLELATEFRPIQGLTFSAWAAWNEAVLTRGFPVSSGLATGAGDPLPFGPRFSAHFSVDEQFALPGGVIGFVGGEIAYQGGRRDAFQGSVDIPRISLPAFAKIDVHGGAKYGDWTINIYANNATNRLGVIGGGIQAFNGTVVFIQPRTVGVNLSRSF